MNRVWRSFGGLLVLALVGLCAVSGCPGPEPQAAGIGGGTGTTSSSSSTTSSTDTTPSGTSTGAQCSCPELDVLFLHDNSDSITLAMWADLVNALFQSASPIMAMLDRACSFHVGVVTCTPEVNNPEGCRALGDLSRVDNDGDLCDVANGMYLTEEDRPDFVDRLQCLLTTEQHSVNGQERPIGAMFAALDPAVNGPGGCNEGFLREGAPLLLIIISDVDDGQSDVDGDQQPDLTQGIDAAGLWHQELLAIKGDDASLLAAIGILGPSGTPDSGCDAESCPEFQDFISKFQNSRRATLPICGIEDEMLIDAVNSLGDELCPP